MSLLPLVPGMDAALRGHRDWGFCHHTGAPKESCHCLECHPEEYETAYINYLRRKGDQT